jgi:hypothetical protein
MGRPRKNPLDAWLDTFSSWDDVTRADAMKSALIADRALIQAEKKKPTEAQPIRIPTVEDGGPK